MFLASSTKSVLIIEPNLDQAKPYSLLDHDFFKLLRVNSPAAAADELNKQKFDLVFLSCSFSSKKMLNLLELIKESGNKQIMPLILVVDLSQPYSIVPGLTWNGQLALLSSLSDAKELKLALAKLL